MNTPIYPCLGALIGNQKRGHSARGRQVGICLCPSHTTAKKKEKMLKNLHICNFCSNFVAELDLHGFRLAEILG